MDIREYQLIAIELETKFPNIIFDGKRSINWNLIFIAFHFLAINCNQIGPNPESNSTNFWEVGLVGFIKIFERTEGWTFVEKGNIEQRRSQKILVCN